MTWAPFNMWFHYPEQNVVFKLINKVASSSIRNTLPVTKIVQIGSELPPTTEAIAVVRHPADRLVSCWANLVRHKKRGTGGDRLLDSLGISRGTPFSEFVRVVARSADGTADPHIASQYWHLVESTGSYPQVFTTTFEFSRLHVEWADVQDWMARRGVENVPPLQRHLRKSTHAPWIDYYKDHPELWDLVVERYTRDFAVWGYSPDLADW